MISGIGLTPPSRQSVRRRGRAAAEGWCPSSRIWVRALTRSNNLRKQAEAAGRGVRAAADPLLSGGEGGCFHAAEAPNSRFPGRKKATSSRQKTTDNPTARKSGGGVFTSPQFLLPFSVGNQLLLAEETPFVYKERLPVGCATLPPTGEVRSCSSLHYRQLPLLAERLHYF